MTKLTKPTKEQVLSVLDRRRHPLDKNLRLLAVVLVITLIAGVFLPLCSVNAELSVTGSDPKDKRLTLLSPAQSVVSVSLQDLIFRRELRDFELYGTPLGDYQMFGVGLYDLILTPIPDLGILSEADRMLGGEWVAFLTNEDFVSFCVNYLGDFGKGVVDVCGFVSDLIDSLRGIVETAEDLMTGIRQTSDMIRSTNEQIISAIGMADTIVTILLLILLAAAVLFIIGKGPRYLAAILLSVGSFLFVAVGIGVLVANDIIAGTLNPAMGELNGAIHEFFASMLPAVSGIIGMIFGTDSFNFLVDVRAVCGAGYWLVTGSLVVLTFLAYFVPAYKKHKEKKAAVLPAENLEQETLA